jgi:hypothetical protein
MRTLASFFFLVIVLLFLGVAAEEVIHHGMARAETNPDPFGIAAQHLRQCSICRGRGMTVDRLLQESTRLPCCRDHHQARD